MDGEKNSNGISGVGFKLTKKKNADSNISTVAENPLTYTTTENGQFVIDGRDGVTTIDTTAEYELQQTTTPSGYSPLQKKYSIRFTNDLTQINHDNNVYYINDTMVIKNWKLIDISGTKTWLDGGKTHDNASEITLTLKRITNDAGNAEVVKENTVDQQEKNLTPSWSGNQYTFSLLPKHDLDGNDYIYSVEENTISEYTTSIDDDYNITNKLTGTTTVEGALNWIDDDSTHKNEDVITLVLKRTSNKMGSSPETVEASPTWSGNSFTFSNLEKYDPEGYEYTYTVEENAIEYNGQNYSVIKDEEQGYSVKNSSGSNVTFIKVSQEGNNITNTITGSLKISKSVRLNGSETDSTNVDGTYTFTIKKNGSIENTTGFTVINGDSTSESQNSVSIQIVKGAAKTVTVSGLPIGRYTVMEATPENGVELLGQNDKAVVVYPGEPDEEIPANSVASFVNNKPHIEVPFSVQKTIKNGTLAGKSFTFTMMQVKDDQSTEQIGALATGSDQDTEQGNTSDTAAIKLNTPAHTTITGITDSTDTTAAAFSPITFNRADCGKTFYFLIQEDLTGIDPTTHIKEHVKYDTKKVWIKVIPTLNAETGAIGITKEYKTDNNQSYNHPAGHDAGFENEQLGKIIIQKTFSGNAVSDSTESSRIDAQKTGLTFTVTGEDYTAKFTYGADSADGTSTWLDGTLTIADLPIGEYTIEESGDDFTDSADPSAVSGNTAGQSDEETNHQTGGTDAAGGNNPSLSTGDTVAESENNPDTSEGESTSSNQVNYQYIHSKSYTVGENATQKVTASEEGNTIVINNRYDTAELVIIKTVENLPDRDADFTFTVTSDDEGFVTITKELHYKYDGSATGNDFTIIDNGGEKTQYKATIRLTHRDGIRLGKTYAVTETTNHVNGYQRTTKMTANGVSTENTEVLNSKDDQDSSDETESTSLSEDQNPSIQVTTGTEDGKGSVEVTNSYEPLPGSLKITKKLFLNDAETTDNNKHLAHGQYTFEVYSITGTNDSPLLSIARDTKGNKIEGLIINVSNGQPIPSVVTVNELPEGQYLVVERATTDGSLVIPPSTLETVGTTKGIRVTVLKENLESTGNEIKINEASYTNSLYYGKITVTKSFDFSNSGLTEPEQKSLVDGVILTITNSKNVKVYESSISAGLARGEIENNDDGIYTLTKDYLPIDTYTITESHDDYGHFTLGKSHIRTFSVDGVQTDDKATVELTRESSGRDKTVDITNTYKNYHLVISKSFEGSESNIPDEDKNNILFSVIPSSGVPTVIHNTIKYGQMESSSDSSSLRTWMLTTKEHNIQPGCEYTVQESNMNLNGYWRESKVTVHHDDSSTVKSNSENTELDSGTAATAFGTKLTIPTENQTGTIAFTNKYKEKPGELKIGKNAFVNLSNPQSGTDARKKLVEGDYQFHITNTEDSTICMTVKIHFDENGSANSASIEKIDNFGKNNNLNLDPNITETPSSGVVTISNLKAGSYKVEEVSSAGQMQLYHNLHGN